MQHDAQRIEPKIVSKKPIQYSFSRIIFGPIWNIWIIDNSANESNADDTAGIAEEDTETSEVSQKDINIRSNEKAFLNRLEKKKQQLSYVTEENIEQFQLDDVEMIVPGHGIPYPKVSYVQQFGLQFIIFWIVERFRILICLFYNYCLHTIFKYSIKYFTEPGS